MRYGLDFSKHEETEECHFKKIPHAQTNEVGFCITSLFKNIIDRYMYCNFQSNLTFDTVILWIMSSLSQGLPIISDCAAVMECRAHSVHTVGDHHVWYGSVSNAEINESEDNPLLYYIR